MPPQDMQAINYAFKSLSLTNVHVLSSSAWLRSLKTCCKTDRSEKNAQMQRKAIKC